MMRSPEVVLANKAPNVRTFTREGAEGFIFAVVESNAKDHRSYKGDILDRFMQEAASGIDIGGFPGEETFAAALAVQLRENESFRKNIGAVFYASLVFDSAVPDKLTIRTAGDIRVHAVNIDLNVCRQTRDHNAIDDDTDGIYQQTMLDQRDFLRHVPTRAIPTTERKPVERVEWTLDDIKSLVICSSVVHRYREPETYIKELLGDLSVAVPSLGFAARVTIGDGS
jgi:hypothetical protein